MSYLQIGRLVLGPPPSWHEAVGDPITNLGGQAIPAPRQALRHQITISTLAGDGLTDTLAQRLVLRRQLRSMLNNTPLKLQSYLYIIYSDDPDQNGWYVPDFGQLSDGEGASGLATGWWNLEQVAWIMAGHKYINREARNVWMKDLRTGLNSRDYLRSIFSTDFSGLTNLQLTALPHGATSIANAVNGQVPILFPFLAGRDGGVTQIAVGLADLACIAYDRPDSAWGTSDVIMYDRQGATDAPAAGPGPTWIEAYGPGFAWSWVSATPTGADCPVLDNGLVRVRWNSSNTPGFSVDVWTGSAYAEQGKMIMQRMVGTVTDDNTWVSASVAEYTFDRAVIKVVVASSNDASSRETIYLTLQRGEMSVTFEAYPAPRADGTPADTVWEWAPFQSGAADVNESVAAVATLPFTTPGNARYASTAGTGAGTGHSGLWPLGESTLSLPMAENWMCILRCPSAFATIGPYQTTLSVVQAGLLPLYTGNGDQAYAGSIDSFRISPGGAQLGYCQVQVGFGSTVADQIMEAETMTLGTSTSTVVDGSASGTGSNTTQTVRTTDANFHVSRANWPSARQAQYRVFARVRATGAQTKMYAKTGATTGATVTLASPTTPTYIWVDLGEVTANNSTLEIHAWTSTGSGTIDVDRIEAIATQDRTRAGSTYSGARDQGQAALSDSRVEGCLVAR